MKNILGIVSIIVLIFCVKAVDIDGYAGYVNEFSPETDIIRGHILNASGILKEWRYNGDIKFNKNLKKAIQRSSGDSCSFSDTSDNPMTYLVIQLFPSAGLTFNAAGRGSLEELQKNVDIVNLIAGMFKIAEEVRFYNKKNAILELLEEIEKEITQNSETNAYLNKQAENKKNRLKAEKPKGGNPEDVERLARKNAWIERNKGQKKKQNVESTGGEQKAAEWVDTLQPPKKEKRDKENKGKNRAQTRGNVLQSGKNLSERKKAFLRSYFGCETSLTLGCR